MKLFIILLCLLSERYLPHAASFYRFNWFQNYFSSCMALSKNKNPTRLILLTIVPVILMLWIFLSLFGNIFYGVIGFIVNLSIFYYCLGPQNPFYPVRDIDESTDPNAAARHYLIGVNNQLFALIFWFILSGPLAVLTYRLLTCTWHEEETRELSEKIVSLPDWITVRVTLLLYLLAGNFQRGFRFFSRHWLSAPDKNADFLGQGGLLAAVVQDETEVITLTAAQEMVERALIIFLVFIAIFTLAASL
jgi:AmpE protein